MRLFTFLTILTGTLATSTLAKATTVTADVKEESEEQSSKKSTKQPLPKVETKVKAKAKAKTKSKAKAKTTVKDFDLDEEVKKFGEYYDSYAQTFSGEWKNDALITLERILDKEEFAKELIKKNPSISNSEIMLAFVKNGAGSIILSEEYHEGHKGLFNLVEALDPICKTFMK